MPWSRQHSVNGHGGFIHDANRTADIGHVLFLRIDPKAKTDGCEQVRHRYRTVFHPGSILAGLADYLAALDSTSAEDNAPGVREMIAANLWIDLWCSPKFPHPRNQNRVDQAALVEVIEECSPTRVEYLTEFLYGREIVLVRVPSRRRHRGA